MNINAVRDLIYRGENEVLFDLYKGMGQMARMGYEIDKPLFDLIGNHLVEDLDTWVTSLPGLSYNMCQAIKRSIDGESYDICRSILGNPKNRVLLPSYSNLGLGICVHNESAFPVSDFTKLSVWFNIRSGLISFFICSESENTAFKLGDYIFGGPECIFENMDSYIIPNIFSYISEVFHFIESVMDVPGYFESRGVTYVY